jgi:hypothetical protein
MYKHTLIVYCEGAGHIPIYILEKAYEIMNCTDSTTFLSEIGNFVQCADERELTNLVEMRERWRLGEAWKRCIPAICRAGFSGSDCGPGG